MEDQIIRLIGRPGPAESAGSWLKKQLTAEYWTTFRALVAFAKSSGVQHIQADLYHFAKRAGTTVQITIGIDHAGTSLEALQNIWRLLHGNGSLFVTHEEQAGNQHPTFHPKVYLFRNETAANFLIGSANLTGGGLFTNYEASLCIDIPEINAKTAPILTEVEGMLDECQTPSPVCKLVDETLLLALYEQGLLPSEREIDVVVAATKAARRVTKPSGPKQLAIFGKAGKIPVPSGEHMPFGLPEPPVKPKKPTGPLIIKPAVEPADVPPSAHAKLYMEVVPHGNGEVFLSYLAAQEDPAFFVWPFNGFTTPHRPNNPPYPMRVPDPVVNIRVHDADGSVTKQRLHHSLNMVDYERNHEIRITLPEGMHDVPARSLLIMTRNPEPGIEYELTFHPPGSAALAAAEGYLTSKMPSGGAPQPRRYGWS